MRLFLYAYISRVSKIFLAVKIFATGIFLAISLVVVVELSRATWHTLREGLLARNIFHVSPTVQIDVQTEPIPLT